MGFTTWAALKAKMLNDLEAGIWRVQSYRVGGPNGPETRYRTFQDFKEALDYVTEMAKAESGGTIRRTLAAYPGSSG